MDYQKEQKQKKIQEFLSILKLLIKRVLSILFAVILIITFFISFNFFRDVILGDFTVTEFKNNLFGIPTNKLLQINQQIQNQDKKLKEWFENLKTKLSR